MRGLLGILFLLFLAWCLGERRRGDYPRQIPWRTVVVGLGLQAALAVLLMRFSPASHALLLLNRAALALQEATDRGTAFVFGYLGGGALPFVQTAPGASFILAFKILPLVLTISALSALLYYWGVLQAVTRAFAWVLRRSMGISGALRSEERRVGKEGRVRWSAYHERKKAMEWKQLGLCETLRDDH